MLKWTAIACQISLGSATDGVTGACDVSAPELARRKIIYNVVWKTGEMLIGCRGPLMSAVEFVKSATIHRTSKQTMLNPEVHPAIRQENHLCGLAVLPAWQMSVSRTGAALELSQNFPVPLQEP